MSKERYRVNPDRAKEYAKEYYRSNLDIAKEYSKEYREANRRELAEYNKQYGKRRRAEDPVYALAARIRNLIRKSLRRNGFAKRSRTQEILGCSYEDFLAHLQSQFLPGMAWNNRRLWHIDHYVPVASAKTEEELLRLNHYTNLRPLWAADNLSKGAKVPYGEIPR
jgi:hypothetical protein